VKLDFYKKEPTASSSS